MCDCVQPSFQFIMLEDAEMQNISVNLVYFACKHEDVSHLSFVHFVSSYMNKSKYILRGY